MTWARLLAGAAAAAGLWVAIGPMALHGAASLALLGTGPVATGAALILCAAGVVGLSRGRQAGARFSGLLVLLLTIVGTLIHAPAIVATPPGLLLWDLVTRHGWIDNASAQVLMVCGVGLFIPLRSGSPRLRDASSAFVAAVLLAGGLARLSGFLGGGLAWDPFAGMPAPVAAGAIALGGALLFVRRGVALLGAPVAGWRQIPFTVTITLAALSCVLWRSLSMERSRSALPMEHRDVVAIAGDVHRAVQTHANVLKRLVYRPVTNTADWARSALGQSSTLPAYAAIAWVTPALETRVVASPDPGRREAIDLKGLAVGKALVKQARTTNAVVVSRPVAVDVDGDAFLSWCRRRRRAASEGVAVGLVLYHDLFASIPSVRRAGVEIADGPSALYRAGPERPAGGPLAWMPIGVARRARVAAARLARRQPAGAVRFARCRRSSSASACCWRCSPASAPTSSTRAGGGRRRRGGSTTTCARRSSGAARWSGSSPPRATPRSRRPRPRAPSWPPSATRSAPR